MFLYVSGVVVIYLGTDLAMTQSALTCMSLLFDS